VAIVAADGASTPPVVAEPDDPDHDDAAPAFRADGKVVVAEQTDDGHPVGTVLDPVTGEVSATFDYGTDAAVVDQSYDATGTWLLVTFADGTLRWYGGGQRGQVPGSYRAGDW
jgi:hypothetical protein